MCGEQFGFYFGFRFVYSYWIYMNKQIKALKMAIEALEDFSAQYANLEPIINSCKEALEQPAQMKMNKTLECPSYLHGMKLEQPAPEYDINEMIDKITPENLQEPVAQPLTRDWIGTALERADKDEAFRKGLINELAQPLSDVEIDAFINPMPQNIQNDDLRELIRAIEQAHGIK